MATIMNVLVNAAFEQLAAKSKKRTATQEMSDAADAGYRTAQEVNARNHPDENWKIELEELHRRFQGLPSVDEAEGRLAALESSIAEHAATYDSQIKAAYDAATTPFLTRLEQAEAGRRIEVLSEQLRDLRRNTRWRLAQAKALVETAKTWNPKRERYEELRKRQASIDAALRRV